GRTRGVAARGGAGRRGQRAERGGGGTGRMHGSDARVGCTDRTHGSDARAAEPVHAPHRGRSPPDNPPGMTAIRDAWRLIGVGDRQDASHPGRHRMPGGLSVSTTVRTPTIVGECHAWRVIGVAASATGGLLRGSGFPSARGRTVASRSGRTASRALEFQPRTTSHPPRIPRRPRPARPSRFRHAPPASGKPPPPSGKPALPPPHRSPKLIRPPTRLSAAWTDCMAGQVSSREIDDELRGRVPAADAELALRFSQFFLAGATPEFFGDRSAREVADLV